MNPSLKPAFDTAIHEDEESSAEYDSNSLAPDLRDEESDGHDPKESAAWIRAQDEARALTVYIPGRPAAFKVMQFHRVDENVGASYRQAKRYLNPITAAIWRCGDALDTLASALCSTCMGHSQLQANEAPPAVLSARKPHLESDIVDACSDETAAETHIRIAAAIGVEAGLSRFLAVEAVELARLFNQHPELASLFCVWELMLLRTQDSQNWERLQTERDLGQSRPSTAKLRQFTDDCTDLYSIAYLSRQALEANALQGPAPDWPCSSTNPDKDSDSAEAQIGIDRARVLYNLDRHFFDEDSLYEACQWLHNQASQVALTLRGSRFGSFGLENGDGTGYGRYSSRFAAMEPALWADEQG